MTKFLLLAFAYIAHPFYVSVFTISQEKNANNLEVSCRIFFDDLEDALQKEYQQPFNLVKPQDKEQTERLMAQYLEKNLRVQVNGKAQPLRYLGYSIEEDAAWCFLEAENVGVIKQLELLNSVLYASHEKQSNILHITIGGQRKSTKLDNPKTKASFDF